MARAAPHKVFGLLLILAFVGPAAAAPLLPYISCLPGVACTQGGPNNTGTGDPLQTWAWKINLAISAINSGGGGGGGGITGLTGDATGSGFGTIATTVTGINGQNLAALGTGLLLNTTGTGVPTIAAQTGTGSVVFSISPALVTPNLGIPSFIDLRNAVNSPPTSFPPCDPFQIVANNTAGSASPICTSSITLQNIVIGPSGGSISYTGSGVNDANYIGHLAVPVSAGLLGTNGLGQLISVASISEAEIAALINQSIYVAASCSSFAACQASTDTTGAAFSSALQTTAATANATGNVEIKLPPGSVNYDPTIGGYGPVIFTGQSICVVGAGPGVTIIHVLNSLGGPDSVFKWSNSSNGCMDKVRIFDGNNPASGALIALDRAANFTLGDVAASGGWRSLEVISTQGLNIGNFVDNGDNTTAGATGFLLHAWGGSFTGCISASTSGTCSGSAGTILTLTSAVTGVGLVSGPNAFKSVVISGTGVTGGTYLTTSGAGGPFTCGSNVCYTVSASQLVASTTINAVLNNSDVKIVNMVSRANTNGALTTACRISNTDGLQIANIHCGFAGPIAGQPFGSVAAGGDDLLFEPENPKDKTDNVYIQTYTFDGGSHNYSVHFLPYQGSGTYIGNGIGLVAFGTGLVEQAAVDCFRAEDPNVITIDLTGMKTWGCAYHGIDIEAGTDVNINAGSDYNNNTANAQSSNIKIGGVGTLVTNADTPSGAVLPFASLGANAPLGVSIGSLANATNVPANDPVIAISNTSVTLATAISGDVPNGATITFSPPGGATTVTAWNVNGRVFDAGGSHPPSYHIEIDATTNCGNVGSNVYRNVVVQDVITNSTGACTPNIGMGATDQNTTLGLPYIANITNGSIFFLNPGALNRNLLQISNGSTAAADYPWLKAGITGVGVTYSCAGTDGAACPTTFGAAGGPTTMQGSSVSIAPSGAALVTLGNASDSTQLNSQSVELNGNNLWISIFAPTIGAGFGAGAAFVPAFNTTKSFSITAAGTPTTSTALTAFGALAAGHRWVCQAQDQSNNFTARQTAGTITSVTFTWSSAPLAGDIINIQCDPL